MICPSPIFEKNSDLIPSFELYVCFIMDNLKIIPDDDILAIIDDPIYYSFQEMTREINSTNVVQIEV